MDATLLRRTLWTDDTMSEPILVGVLAAAAALAVGVIAAAASLVGSLLGAGIPTTLTWWFHRQQRDADIGYLAVTVGAVFDQYIGGCIDVMYDEGMEVPSGEIEPRTSSPRLDLGSLDVNWRSIPATLLERIFAIPNAQLLVQDRLAWEAEFNSYPILVRQIEYGALAEKALDVVTALRAQADLPASPEGRLDYAGIIKEKMPKILKKQQEIEQRQWTPIFQQSSAAPEGG